MKSITDKTLLHFCLSFRRQFWKRHDATLFRNELWLSFYGSDPEELFDRCVANNFIRCDAGDVIIKVGGKHD